MIRIFDCSNSTDRPVHRGYGGPKENACVSLLKKHATHFDVEWVANPANADVIFTNDVFPSYVFNYNVPRVKRMDGIFWQKHLWERNESLNDAAYHADHVIFVSEYSRRSYYQLCGEPLKSESVALNWVDTDIFYPRFDISNDWPERWLAVATSWKREEKRGNQLYLFRSVVMPLLQFRNSRLTVVGHDASWVFAVEQSDPNYYYDIHQLVKIIDYIESPEELANLMRHHDALVNLSYRDASPKVVAEAASCGLPILYANSGGTPELVSYGVGIVDKNCCQTEEHTPTLRIPEIKVAMMQFNDQWKNLRRVLLHNSDLPKQRMWNMLNQYYSVFKKLISESKR